LHSITIEELYRIIQEGNKITLMTAYDYPIARIEDEIGVDVILVGDSIATTVFGKESTIGIPIDTMLYHSEAVSRACERAMVIGDMPFMSYQTSRRDAILNAGRFIAEGKCDAVKLEGGKNMIDKISAIVKSGIPVMGHIGLQPQSYHLYSGYKVQGKNADKAIQIMEDAIAVEDAGAFAIIVESVPENVTQIIQNTVNIPIIGIGAGNKTDGQIIVINDILGLNFGRIPKFVKVYKDIKSDISLAISEYIKEVKSGAYPSEEYIYHMNKDEINKLNKMLKKKSYKKQ